MTRLFAEMGWKAWLVVYLTLQAYVAEMIALPMPEAHAQPAYCYTTGQWLPFPEISGYCPDGQAPFNNVGPSYGGGNHRWPDGSDD